jgi:hypothetical protein
VIVVVVVVLDAIVDGVATLDVDLDVVVPLGGLLPARHVTGTGTGTGTGGDQDLVA